MLCKPQGNAGECLKYLGMIRARVGISSANNYGLGSISDRYQLLKAVLNERQIELAYRRKACMGFETLAVVRRGSRI